MNPILLISVNVLFLVIGGVALRLWLRGRPDAVSAHRRLCGAVMWLACFVCVAGLVLALTHAPAVIGLLLTTTGLSIVVSMLLKRSELARKSAGKPNKD